MSKMTLGNVTYRLREIHQAHAYLMLDDLADEIDRIDDEIRSAGEHCQCIACKDGIRHDSDCAVHNEPAMPRGSCDCCKRASIYYAIDDHLRRDVKVPDGWQLVPIEPTEKMFAAVQTAIANNTVQTWCGILVRDPAMHTWKAMLAAAPTHSSATDGQGGERLMVPDALNPFEGQPEGLNYADGWNACREAMLKGDDK